MFAYTGKFIFDFESFLLIEFPMPLIITPISLTTYNKYFISTN